MPHGFCLNNTKRPQYYLSTKNHNYQITLTSIIVFFNPPKCYVVCDNGKLCMKRHRTAYQFCVDHNQYSPHEVHISHLCHFGSCINWRHLVIEPAKVNLRRNNCRRNCQCGGKPQCFHDSN